MAWEMLLYGGRQAYVQDTDLMVLRHFLMETLKRTSEADIQTDSATLAELYQYVSSWELVGVGVVVGFDLQRFLKDSPDRTSALLSLLQQTSDDLSVFDREIPHSYLESHINKPAYGYTRLSAMDVRKIIAKFCNIIAPLNSAPLKS